MTKIDMSVIEKIGKDDIVLVNYYHQNETLYRFNMSDKMNKCFKPLFEQHKDALDANSYYKLVNVEYWQDVKEIHYYLDIQEDWINIDDYLNCQYLNNIILQKHNDMFY